MSTVQTGDPSIIPKSDPGVSVIEGSQTTLTCNSSGGAPLPSLSWYREDGGDRVLLETGGPDPLILEYTGDRNHNGHRLVCEADQTEIVTRAEVRSESRNLNVQCKLRRIVNSALKQCLSSCSHFNYCCI